MWALIFQVEHYVLEIPVTILLLDVMEEQLPFSIKYLLVCQFLVVAKISF